MDIPDNIKNVLSKENPMLFIIKLNIPKRGSDLTNSVNPRFGYDSLIRTL